MLKITIHEDQDAVAVKLEGRIAGPWAEELSRVWVETAPRVASRKLSLDLRQVTYADANGERVLKGIYAEREAELVASTPWTQYLAEVIKKSSADNSEEAKDGNDA
ncbi:MAG: hypothetical protein WB608_03245 [Terracidiphilus sp.]